MPRYVILEHDHPRLHWDLMLEAGEALQTWRLHGPPQPGEGVVAEPSFDHRLAYLDYEGPVSGGRGRVRRWDSGTYRKGEESGDGLVLHLDGGRLRGTAELTPSTDGGWRLSFAGEAASSRPG
jgi:hypothetical protein